MASMEIEIIEKLNANKLKGFPTLHTTFQQGEQSPETHIVTDLIGSSLSWF